MNLVEGDVDIKRKLLRLKTVTHFLINPEIIILFAAVECNSYRLVLTTSHTFPSLKRILFCNDLYQSPGRLKAPTEMLHSLINYISSEVIDLFL